MNGTDPIDTAWRIHAAQVDWTGKVDSKANFALAIESALLVGIIGASKDGILSKLSGVQLWSCRIGVALLVAAVVLAMSVVIPRLRSKQAKTEWKNNFIYFGHVRHWDSDKLAEKIQDAELLPILSRQIIHMGDIAWIKHRGVQWSLCAGLAGAAFVGLAPLLRAA